MLRHWRPHGATPIDVLAATALVFFGVAIIVVFLTPGYRLAKERDEVRVDNVRNIMEAIIAMETSDPVRIDAIAQSARASGAPPRVMIGNGVSCAGDWGRACTDDILADRCLDLAEFSVGYISFVPIDENPHFTDAASGYYVDFSYERVEVGACSPETQTSITLTHEYQEEI